MPNLEGMKNKFLVIKRDYIKSEQAKKQAELLCEYADAQRVIQTGKVNPATYLVINTDEPYTNEVIDILKRYGHWG